MNSSGTPEAKIGWDALQPEKQQIPPALERALAASQGSGTFMNELLQQPGGEGPFHSAPATVHQPTELDGTPNEGPDDNFAIND